ncbi:MAG TPA: DNA-processing protein DprA [Abditibacteriaceae bacterium]|nr:DNA-processing protein DprA [Abditibacteriaceae bacterium]
MTLSAETPSVAPPGISPKNTANAGELRHHADVEAWLRLAFVALPAGRCNAALALWEHPRQLLEAAQAGRDEELLKTPGITPTTVERLRESSTRNLQPALDAMQAHSIRLMLRSDNDYPKSLEAIPDPPPYIFLRGDISPSDEVAVGIVGTRHTTDYGRGIAHALSRDLASRGVTVVSGLARGVDTAAHRGALEGGGRTFAVCGCGLDVIYPPENKNLMEQISQNGACWSEFAPTTHPESWHFPARNRIISGLSAGVIVVEAGERSGALITADFAMEQGRDVFAVPGNIHKVQSRGAHALIKQGATLIENADDVLAALNNRALPFERVEKSTTKTASSAKSSTRTSRKSESAPQLPLPRADLTQTENRIYLSLDVEPRHMDDIAVSAQMGAGEANSTLVMLELKGHVRRLPGGMFVRAA